MAALGRTSQLAQRSLAPSVPQSGRSSAHRIQQCTHPLSLCPLREYGLLRSPARQHSQVLCSQAGESRPSATAGGFWTTIELWATRLTSLFPLWVALGCASGYYEPSLFDWFRPAYVTAMLSVTMLGMGFTLSMQDVRDVLNNPARVSIGTALQYTIMPALGFALSRLPGLPPGFAAGIILVACCPGGTASNIVTYLANADVALSVMMTTVSTLAAVVMTPLLTTRLIGTLVPVDGAALFVSTLQVVLAPVIVGVALKTAFPKTIQRITPYSPLCAVVMVALICASVMARSAAAAQQANSTLLLAIFALHAGGFCLGYVSSRVLGMPEPTARTNSIEVGMQNSTLGASLALLHFADPLVAAPCAISACMHSILGSLIAGVWRFIPTEPTERQGAGPAGAAATAAPAT